MKTLILLRHAKSSREDPSWQDIDRPLNDRGVRASELIGNHIRKHKIVPDLVISSPSKRTRQTADLVLESARLKVEPKFDDRIYEATARLLFEVIRDVDDAVSSILMIGHNPGFEDLFESLTGEAHRFPTAALAYIELEVEHWSEVRPTVGNLKWLVKPKELKRAE